MLTQNLPDFWEQFYTERKAYWDLKKATPALQEFFTHPSCPASGSVLVPGAGFGYDAEAWALRGHQVLAVDFSPTAVDELDRLSRKHKNFKSLDLDLFELSPKDPKKGGAQFDIVYDYCTFSAIHPGRRDEYLEVWHKMLKDDGIVIALFYPLAQGSTMKGPPHNMSEVELMARLDGVFEVAERIPAEKSIESRQGKEEFWILKKSL
ncbi:MAG: methyltransferase [Fibrobacter sp.]|jgi:SAM-dependent methyltransferase|nr:methyltransferase [Fibrobacter sp.]